jgi:hypothetical protein
MKTILALFLSLVLVLAAGIVSMACEEEDNIYRCEHNNPYTPTIPQCFEFTAGTSEGQAAEWCENLTIGMLVDSPELKNGECDWDVYQPAGYCDCDMNNEDPEAGCPIRNEGYASNVKGFMIAEVSPKLSDPEMDCDTVETFSAAWGCDIWHGVFVCTVDNPNP